ncbi:MAG: hypothetical protein R3B91_22715 [Planctomycetaceae bacterium]
MSAAVALSNLGKRVLVLEQHYLPGGWTHTFALDGQVQSGRALHRPTERGRANTEATGRSRCWIRYRVSELNPDGYDHIVFQDETFDIPRGREKFVNRLIDRFPDERRGIERYFGIDATGRARTEPREQCKDSGAD